MRVFETETRLEAWLEATDYLLSVENDLNVILHIKSPESDEPFAQAAIVLADKYFVSANEYPIHTVAETIFPAWEYRRRGLEGMFERYADQEYDLIKKGGMNPWGTYAYRLMRRSNSAGKIINPIQQLIEKMKDEKNKPGPKKSCYEIGVAEGEYDLPLYSTVKDQTRRLGGPCLSHLSFKLYENKVHLTAIYRSHDYRYKVLGNLLGLARLQACVAREVGLGMGSLVVHSTYANLGPGSKEKLEKLLAAIRQLRGERA